MTTKLYRLLFVLLSILGLPGFLLPHAVYAQQSPVTPSQRQVMLPLLQVAQASSSTDTMPAVLAQASATPAPRPDVGPFQSTHIWPIDGATVAGLSSTYGPRQKASADLRYDWHRGIDIPADCGTAVRAVADGVVRLAVRENGHGYSDTMVQIQHTKPSSSTDYYYSNYMHLESITETVAVSRPVTQGQVIGYSGDSQIGFSSDCHEGEAAGGFDHLHFEIRDGGVLQKHAINPLLVLQPNDQIAPLIHITGVDARNPLSPVVSVRVQVPDSELDLKRVEITTYDNSSGSLVKVDGATFDMHDWNYNYTPYDGSSDLTILDTAPAYDGIYDGDYGRGPVTDAPLGVAVSPARFNADSGSYVIDLRFTDLVGAASASSLVVKATATDLYGTRAEVTTPSPALYVWRQKVPITLASAQTLAAFAVAEGIQTLYYDNFGCGALSATCPAGSEKQDAATLASILAFFHAQGLRVEALYTDNTRVGDLVTYNAAVQPNQRFDAVRLDIEKSSFQSGHWPGGDLEPTKPADLDVYAQAVSAAGALPVYVSIAHHWDEPVLYNGITKPAYQHILDIVAGVDIQTVQDTTSAIVDITKDEICYANQWAKPAHVTLETYDVVRYMGMQPFNTFFEEGKAGMKSTLAGTNAAYSAVTVPCSAPLPSGYAYHFYTQSYGAPEWQLCPPLTGGVQLFGEANCSGTSRPFTTAGNINLSDFDNTASSLALAPGWSARVFERPNQRGPSSCVEQRKGELTSTSYEGYTLPLDNSISSLILYDNSSCTPALEVVEQLTFSPASAYVGEQVTATFALKNTGIFPITPYNLRVAGGEVGCNALHVCNLLGAFPWDSSPILLPGQTYTFSKSRSFLLDDVSETILFNWWYMGTNYRLGNPVTLHIAPGLEANTAVVVTPTSTLVNQPVTAQVVVTNVSPRPITVAGIYFRSCLYNPVTGAESPCQYPSTENRPLVTVQPGQLYTQTQVLSFSQAGYYRIVPIYGDQGTGGWGYVRNSGPINGASVAFVTVTAEGAAAAAQADASDVVAEKWQDESLFWIGQETFVPEDSVPSLVKELPAQALPAVGPTLFMPLVGSEGGNDDN